MNTPFQLYLWPRIRIFPESIKGDDDDDVVDDHDDEEDDEDEQGPGLFPQLPQCARNL